MTARSGKRSVTSGMNGPENEPFGIVEMIVGTLKSLAALAKTCTLFNVTSRSCDWTPWYIAG